MHSTKNTRYENESLIRGKKLLSFFMFFAATYTVFVINACYLQNHKEMNYRVISLR